MARKNPFANLLEDDKVPAPDAAVLSYAVKGASRSFISSIDEMAARADSLLAGEAVVELDPETVDASFVQDRLDDDGEEFDELVKAIQERGQDSPILVRPHPTTVSRYMVIFGHRRLRAARTLGKKIRAVVKEVDDRDHVVAQGQENSARANLSFIERARFAARVVSLGYDQDNAVAMSALAIDRTTLSKMLSICALPAEILTAVGSAKSIGRDRWYELKLLLDKPSNLKAALDYVHQLEQPRGGSDSVFNALLAHIKIANSNKRLRPTSVKRVWSPQDRALSAEIVADGKRFSLALKAKGTDARAFGDYLSGNLDNIYEAFRQTTKSTEGGG